MRAQFGFGGIRPVFSSFELVGTPTKGSGPSITLPAGSQAGDFCNIFNWAYNPAGGTANVIPADFTSAVGSAATDAGRTMRGRISAKILTGSEAGLTGLDESVERWIAMTWRPNAPISGFVFNSSNQELTTGNPAAQTIAAAIATPLPILLVGQMANNQNAISPRTTSPAMNEIAGADTRHYAHWFQYAAGETPGDHTYNMDDEGGVFNLLQSGYFTFTPG